MRQALASTPSHCKWVVGDRHGPSRLLILRNAVDWRVQIFSVSRCLRGGTMSSSHEPRTANARVAGISRRLDRGCRAGRRRGGVRPARGAVFDLRATWEMPAALVVAREECRSAGFGSGEREGLAAVNRAALRTDAPHEAGNLPQPRSAQCVGQEYGARAVPVAADAAGRMRVRHPQARPAHFLHGPGALLRSGVRARRAAAWQRVDGGAGRERGRVAVVH